METNELLPQLFRSEYRKIVAVLGKHFGFDQLEIAEDIASDTFLVAAETWGIKGLPENPVAWLYKVASNKALDLVRRDTLFANKIAPSIRSGGITSEQPFIDLSDQHIKDSQLQMMFAVCHPTLAPEAQIGLALRILCGFGIDEIADAFLSNRETINKRLFRAREKLREENISIELPPSAEIGLRLRSVLTTIYLLFNEGYYSSSQDMLLRRDLCLEAMRLNLILIDNENTDLPEVDALFALMCFHSSRFDARTDEKGELIRYDEQDSSLWNAELILRGQYYLNRASRERELSQYHIEAAIAYWHTIKSDTPEKWQNILQLYNRLLQIVYSPVAALNRTFALAKANGKQEAIKEAEKLQLTDNHFYHCLLGYLYTGLDTAKATSHLQQALALAKTDTERGRIRKDLDNLVI